MEISGKIIQVLPERGGVSQRTGSEWKVGSYILETMEQYPKKCVFEVFGSDKIAQMNIQVGQSLTVSLDIDAHEYNGRWYNQIRAWRVQPYDPNAPVAAAAPAAAAPFPAAQPAGQPAAQPMAAAPQTEAPFPPAQPAAQAAPDAAPMPAFGGESTDDLPF